MLLDAGAFITEVSNYSDPVTEMEMHHTLRPVEAIPRLLVAVSKYDHCLNALLTKWKSGALPADIVGVFSNHEECRGIVEWYGLPFHHLPMTSGTKSEQESQILALIAREKVTLLVLARYMQILSDEFAATLQGQVINIHHSFLTGFKGAKPYHQAYERGVKVIGAAAHYVTAELDEGPIIVQEVRPVNHQVSIQQMTHLGHDIETAALSQAVRLAFLGRRFWDSLLLGSRNPLATPTHLRH
jgi:formyltetrahydrofolate deformylase